jgi:hypothetical protein
LRWLDQVIWMDDRADRAQVRYYGLRLIAVVGGVVVPTLIGLEVGRQSSGDVVRGFTIGLSLLVAVSVAVEELIRYGERFRHYRRTVEQLKSEGWQFFQMSGPYRRHATHREAYMAFAARVEGIIQPSVEVYVGQIVGDKKEEKAKDRSED